MHLRLFLLVILISFTADSLCQDASVAAKDFLASLTVDQRSKATFPFSSDERFNMNFVPLVRKGPSFRDFNSQQKEAALKLLEVSLSQMGYSKALAIIELEKVLNVVEGESRLSDGTLRRDPLNYHYCIFGNPGDKVWAWRFEGHHISLNFVFEKSTMVSSTPSFFGSNPAIVRTTEQKGKQVLKAEMELGFKLVNSLTSDQLKLAKISDTAPHEIITGNAAKPDVPAVTGIPFTALNESQQKTFMALLNVYVDNYQLGFSRTLMSKIEKAGIANLHFAWAGALQPGSGEYYRIQGPMILIEYDNVQNNANHVHTVVRDLANDFAGDILREHYRKEHGK